MVLTEDRISQLFKGLDFTRIDDRAGSLLGLIQEAWRPFLVLMLIALLVEAALCLPRAASEQKSNGFYSPGFNATPATAPAAVTDSASAGRFGA